MRSKKGFDLARLMGPYCGAISEGVNITSFQWARSQALRSTMKLILRLCISILQYIQSSPRLTLHDYLLLYLPDSIRITFIGLFQVSINSALPWTCKSCCSGSILDHLHDFPLPSTLPHPLLRALTLHALSTATAPTIPQRRSFVLISSPRPRLPLRNTPPHQAPNPF